MWPPTHQVRHESRQVRTERQLTENRPEMSSDAGLPKLESTCVELARSRRHLITTPTSEKIAWFLGGVYLYSARHFRFWGEGAGEGRGAWGVEKLFLEIRANPLRKSYLKFFGNMMC